MSEQSTDETEYCGWADDGEICESTDVRAVVTSHGLPDVEAPKAIEFRCEDHIQRLREVNFRTVHKVRDAEQSSTDTERSEGGDGA